MKGGQSGRGVSREALDGYKEPRRRKLQKIFQKSSSGALKAGKMIKKTALHFHFFLSTVSATGKETAPMITLALVYW